MSHLLLKLRTFSKFRCCSSHHVPIWFAVTWDEILCVRWVKFELFIYKWANRNRLAWKSFDWCWLVGKYFISPPHTLFTHFSRFCLGRECMEPVIISICFCLCDNWRSKHFQLGYKKELRLVETFLLAQKLVFRLHWSELKLVEAPIRIWILDSDSFSCTVFGEIYYQTTASID